MNLFACPLGPLPFEAIEEFLGLALPIEQRIPEGTRVDYNVVIAQNLGEDVAAFSNSDGGIIFIGIKADKEKQNVPVEWPGLPPRADYGTQITAKILSTVRPRPEFELGWASTPGGNYIYIVRVRPGSYPPYEYEQGNTVRIPLRVHDGKRAATVRDIESLFARRSGATANPETRVLTYLNAPDFRCMKRSVVNGQEGDGVDDEFQRIVIVPRAGTSFRLDRKLETEFEKTVFNCFPDEPESWEREVRGAYVQISARRLGQFPWHHLWRIYQSGALAFTGSIAGDFPGGKPIGDLASDLLGMCALARQMFQQIEIYGDVDVGYLVISADTEFVPKFPVAGAFRDYDAARGIRIPQTRAARVNRASDLRVLDTSELATPVNPIAELLMDVFRELRGISFDSKLLLEAIETLVKGRGPKGQRG